MTVMKRMSRLFRADFNAVLDRLEEPEALLQQAIREMDEQIHEDKKRAALLTHELDVLASRRDKLRKTVAHIDAELDLGFESGDETLARNLVRRKLSAEKGARSITEKHAEVETLVERCRARLEQNEARLGELREKAEILGTSGDSSSLTDADDEVSITADEVEIALLRERKARNFQ
jgi:phage shock protein A